MCAYVDKISSSEEEEEVDCADCRNLILNKMSLVDLFVWQLLTLLHPTHPPPNQKERKKTRLFARLSFYNRSGVSRTQKWRFPLLGIQRCQWCSLFKPEVSQHGSGMSNAMTASQKPSFRALWRVGDAVVDRGNAGWTTSKTGLPCPCQNLSLIHIWRCRRRFACRSRWSPYH